MSDQEEIVPDDLKTLPVKMENMTVGFTRVVEDGTVELVLMGENHYVQQLLARIKDGTCAGLAVLPVRNPDPTAV